MASSSGGYDGPVLVIGLGRFGSALGDALMRTGHDVLGVDNDPRLVQEYATRLTHVVEADSTSEAAMRQLGAVQFDVAVCAIGTGLEASMLTTAVLQDLGIKQIWAKAITSAHGRILERIGATHVVYPEAAMGERVAHLVSGKMIDFIEFDDGFAIVKTRAPQESWDRPLGESKMRSKYGVTIVGVKRPGEDFTYAQADTVVTQGDTLIVSGRTELVEKFAAIT